MKYYIKRIGFAVCIVLLIFVIDRVLCHRTYYFPQAKIFVNFKWCNLERHTTDTIEVKNKWDFKYIRINFFSEHLLSARFARPFSDKVDWIAMWPPSDFGDPYLINTDTREIIIAGDTWGSPDVDHRTEMMKIKHDTPEDAYLIDSRTGREQLSNSYVTVVNATWVFWDGFYFYPSNSAIKAHLWHLFY